MALSVQNNEWAKMLAKRRWVRRLGWFDLPQMASVVYLGKRLYVDLTDWKGPSYHVLNWGVETYESTSRKFLADYFKTEPNGVFFDVGANIGIFSLSLASEFPNVEVHAFEPEPKTYSCLQRTFSNDTLKNVHTHNVALSDSIGTATLFFDKENHGGHSLQEHAIVEDGSKIGGSTLTETDTLDNFTSRKNFKRLDFIKMDVQRHEADVLLGSKETVRKFRPIFLMECYFEDLAQPESGLLAPFIDQGYSIIEMTQRQQVEFNLDSLKALNSQGESYRDLAFVPNEKVQIFR